MRSQALEQLRLHDWRPVARLLTVEVLLEAAARCSLKVLASPRNVLTLVWLALAAARRPDDAFASLLAATAKALKDQEGFDRTPLAQLHRQAQRPARPKKHDPRAGAVDRVSEEAFVKARRRLPQAFWLTLLLLSERFQQQHAAGWRYRHFRLLAVDGTRLTLPNWPALRQAFGTANNGHGRHGAQARLVLQHFPLARLPYRYDLVPLAQGEPTVARRLVADLRADDLLLLDAGFCSYGLLRDIQQRQAFFVLRQPRALNLRTLRALSPGDCLVRWTPKDSRGQWRREGWPRSMDLRRLVYRRRGYRPLTLLTNVLDAPALPWAEVRHLVQDERTGVSWCAGVYHRRWQVETSLWELQVVQRLEGGLHSRSEGGIRYEVGGHVLWYFLMRWLLVEAAAAHGAAVLALSYQEAQREVGEMGRWMLGASAAWAEGTLAPRLLERLAGHKVRIRPGRQYPRTKKKHARAQKKTKQG